MSRPPFDEPRDQMPVLREGDHGVLVPAIKLSMVFVSLADGPLNLPEKEGLLSIWYPSLRHEKTPGQVLTFFQELVDMTLRLGGEKLAEMILVPARALSPESKSQVIEGCVAIAEIDGPMVEEEKVMIETIASWIDTPWSGTAIPDQLR